MTECIDINSKKSGKEYSHLQIGSPYLKRADSAGDFGACPFNTSNFFYELNRATGYPLGRVFSTKANTKSKMCLYQK